MHRFLKFSVLIPAMFCVGCSTVKTDQEVTSRFDPDRIEVDMDRDNISRSFQAPLYMLNFKKEDIPDHLPDASETYIEPTSCLLAKVEYDELNVLLGSDEATEAVEQYSSITLDAGDAIESTITDFIPFDSVIKYVSGATKHEKKVASAFFRGQIRRAYLKGYVERNHCQVPTPVAKPGSNAAEHMRRLAMLSENNTIYVEPSADEPRSLLPVEQEETAMSVTPLPAAEMPSTRSSFRGSAYTGPRRLGAN